MQILAYIDPGTGVLIWQSIIGVFVGLFFYLRRTRKRLGALLGRFFRTGPQSGNSTVDLPVNKREMEADHF
jgi:hypothetical protein